MNSIRKPKAKKVILVSMGIVLAVVVSIVSIVYIILRHYIRKMNLVDVDRNREYDYAYAEDIQEYIIDDTDDGFAVTDADTDEDGLATDHSNTDNISMGNDDTDFINFPDYYKDISNIPIIDDKNVFNILLIGSDTRDPDARGRSDAMMLLSINKKKKSIILTSLLRDIYLNIPGKKSNRLNAAYAIGGAKLLMETIEYNFRIKVDNYVSVDFFAFLEIIDAIGGVTVEVTEKELPLLNKHIRSMNLKLNEEADKDVLSAPGKHLLNGKQTLGYCRIRYIGTDFARTARQRKVMEQIFEKMKKAGLLNIIDILNTVLPKVTTNLKEREIISHIINLPDYLRYEFIQCRIPIDGSYENKRIRGMDVLVIDFDKNIKEISQKIYMTE